MDKARDRRVILLVERVQLKRWVIFPSGGSQRNELPPNGIFQWIAPVSNTQHVRCQADRHWSHLHASLDICKKVLARSDMGPC